ncbi:hypothetical protein NSS89_18345 [Caldifermentibacillus hisashii]|uniref:hypothetical protein n=1 Tax=Caldifermentibacillus hisashii TaxID=996558 RepID=UPI0031FDBAEB
MATNSVLVAILRRKTHNFGDETRSRRHFAVKNAQFCRRNLFSSPFCGKKCPILSTKPILVTILR